MCFRNEVEAYVRDFGSLLMINEITQKGHTHEAFYKNINKVSQKGHTHEAFYKNINKVSQKGPTQEAQLSESTDRRKENEKKKKKK